MYLRALSEKYIELLLKKRNETYTHHISRGFNCLMVLLKLSQVSLPDFNNPNVNDYNPLFIKGSKSNNALFYIFS